MTETPTSQGIGSSFAKVYNQLGLAWWVEIKTTTPECIYYFGPFLTSAEAQNAMPGYIQDLEEEEAKGIEAVVRRCKPQNITVYND
ncbi:MAG: DUF1816 domain-containing protein [Cyanobacteria bacterium P01_F01_bin.42]